MSWRTGIAVLSFFGLVLVIQYPNVAGYLRQLTEQPDSVSVPAPVIKAPADGDTSDSGSQQSVSRTVSDANLTDQELRLLALNLINEDRKLNGLSPVALGTNEAAQLHADDMLAGLYLGHWWLDGRKPYMVYSQTGGTSYVSENAARTGFSEQEFAELCSGANVVCQEVNPSEDIERLHNAMVYDDAGSNWSHRENILNPDHRRVSIGIAYSSQYLAFVQHFEGGDVTAPQAPSFEGTILRIRADLNRPNLAIFPTAQVHFEAPPVPHSGEEIEQFTSYCVGGGFSERCGTPLVQIVPPPRLGTHYLNLPDNVIIARSWVISGGDIEIVADLGPFAAEPGIYTTTLFSDGGDGKSDGVLLQLSTVRE